MTEVNFDSLFPSLEAKAARLNEASDNANKVLSGIEKRLIDMNIGIEVWDSEPLDIAIPEGDLGPNKTSSQIVQVLGFARAEGKWCLAVKPIRLVDGFFQGDMDSPFQNRYGAGPPTPLLQAARALRIAALRKMPKFIAALDEHVAETVNEIEKTANKLQFGQQT